MRAFSAARADEVALWLEEPRALVFGDAILGDQSGGLRLTPWAKDAQGLERTRKALLPLLDLPAEVALPSHGQPVLANAREALARALTA
jgi:glyoxylase-like metal-dependent hydrolase (beta-lactamase superfamily II)